MYNDSSSAPLMQDTSQLFVAVRNLAVNETAHEIGISLWPSMTLHIPIIL
jgi:hypothetical protein